MLYCICKNDFVINSYDLLRMENFVVGRHNDAVSCIRHCKSKSYLLFAL